MKANDEFKEYTGSETMFNYTGGLIITEGVKALADKFECYWFLDIIASYQYKVQDEFQAWVLTRTHNSAVIECTDGNGNIYIRQNIQFTDFKADSATLWVEFKTVLLPSEY